MSISDGQMILRKDAPEAGAPAGRRVQLDSTASLSRMGTRAYPPALKDLAPQVLDTLLLAIFLFSLSLFPPWLDLLL
jgi:F0F1-type ATP synthase alpha subunit